LAGEKMREINEAYDFLINKGASGFSGNKYGSDSYSGAGGYSGASGGGRAEFRDIRSKIDRGDIAGAEQKLRSSQLRNAEWHFLSGVVQLRRGWYNEALNSIQLAVSMEPNNIEYRNALNSIMSSAGGYQQSSYQRGYNDSQSQLCQCLSCYCCADACCDI
jgi:molecular chaperone DnaJ